MNTDGGRRMKINGWDSIIPTQEMFNELSRVLRPNGKAVLFSQEPYTSKLITSAIPSLPFLYRAMWYKNTAGNILGAKSAMVSRFEDICIFGSIYRKSHYQADHPLREYFKDEKEKSGLTNKQINEILGNGMASHYFTNGEQFLCPTEQMYKKLQTTGFFERPYEEIKKIDALYVQEIYRKMNTENPQVFNLWQGGKSKSHVLEHKKDNDGYHPTQKPVALLEDLIQTYSNEGNTVLDFTMGSGSTGWRALTPDVDLLE
jgi:site-specific DNA-methyltransferase (adenine-specific)